MDSPNSKELERLNSKHEKRQGTLQIQDITTKSSRSVSWRALDEYWTMPRRSPTVALFSLVSLFALVGCLAFTKSMTAPSHDSFVDDIVGSYSAQISNSKLRRREPLGFASSAGDVLRDQQQGTAAAMAMAMASPPPVPPPVGCNDKDAALRVFMYDLPPEFHYGMLSADFQSKGEIWPRKISDIPLYPGGLYQQHSPEYWLTNDLLTTTMPERRSMCTAYRVADWRSADVIFVPFFASLSYNKHSKGVTHREKQNGFGEKDRLLQEKLMQYLVKQPAWVASGGVDHVVVIHHPNSMQVMREKLRNVMYVVADFGRYPPQVANLAKDVVAPYKHVISDFPDDDTSFESRKTLLFFQGAIKRKEDLKLMMSGFFSTSAPGTVYETGHDLDEFMTVFGGHIRKQLYELIKNEEGVHFASGNTTSGAIHSATRGMRGSKFCLNLAGDTPSSNRLFDSIASHCVPVIISDEIELPFEDELDYSEFCLFVKFSDALRRGFVINLLRGVSSDEWTRMWGTLRQVDRHFRYQHPTLPEDAVHMTWKAILRKVPNLKLFLNRQKRYHSSLRNKLKPSILSKLLFHW